MCYAVQNPYAIIRNTGHGSYYVKKLNKLSSTEFEFMAYDLYSFLQYLKPYKPVDTVYTCYLNQTNTPLVNPLKKLLNIEIYNEKWFSKEMVQV